MPKATQRPPQRQHSNTYFFRRDFHIDEAVIVRGRSEWWYDDGWVPLEPPPLEDPERRREVFNLIRHFCMAASYSITFFVFGASCLRTYFGVTCYVNTKVGHVKRKRKGKQKTLTTVKTNTFLWSFSHKKGLFRSSKFVCFRNVAVLFLFSKHWFLVTKFAQGRTGSCKTFCSDEKNTTSNPQKGK